MSPPDIFRVEFEDAEVNPHAVYRAGQMVAFRVRLKTSKPIKCRAVYAKIFGRSKVKWTQRSGKSSTTYRSEEIYLNEKVAFFTPPSSGPDEGCHPVGEFLYPVSFPVPATAPSSYEGVHGQVRYEIKVSIDEAWKFDTFTTAYFTVIRDMDLNLKPPDQTGPFSMDEQLSVNCCWCCSCCGNVQTSVSVPKRGYVPGEMAMVSLTLNNGSSVDIEWVKVKLLQKTRFFSKSHKKSVDRVVSEVRLDPVPRGETRTFNTPLEIKPLPTSYLEGCNNIEMIYYLTMNAKGGFCVALEHQVCEFLIGTVPILMSPGMQPMPMQLPPPTEGMGMVPMPQPNPLERQGTLPDAPPPSYEECAFGKVDMGADEDEDGQKGSGGWAPSYPVYRGLQYYSPPQ